MILPGFNLRFPARTLDKIEGRWVSPDPAGLAAVDLTNPQTLNRYAYVGGNPLALVDPTGMSSTTGCGWGIFCWMREMLNAISDANSNSGSGGPSVSRTFISTTIAYGIVGDSAYAGASSGGQGGGGGYGDGGNAGRNPPKNGLTPAQLQTILDAAKKVAATCAGTFSAGMSPFGLRFSLKGFDAQIQNTKYLQYPNPATSPLGPLSSVEAQALKGSIALYPNFFTDTSPRQAGIVVHENLHVYTGWSDSNVFSVFQQRGITPNDVTQFMKYGNTDGITTWIVRGCR